MLEEERSRCLFAAHWIVGGFDNHFVRGERAINRVDDFRNSISICAGQMVERERVIAPGNQQSEVDFRVETIVHCRIECPPKPARDSGVAIRSNLVSDEGFFDEQRFKVGDHAGVGQDSVVDNIAGCWINLVNDVGSQQRSGFKNKVGRLWSLCVANLTVGLEVSFSMSLIDDRSVGSTGRIFEQRTSLNVKDF